MRNSGVTATREQSNLQISTQHCRGAAHAAPGSAYPNMKEQLSMTAKVIVITTALTIMGGVLALADGSKLQSVNSANVHAMRMDRCPYYPSPVFCRSGPRARTTSGRLTPPQAAVDIEESKIR
jgi:hypothetical protein